MIAVHFDNWLFILLVAVAMLFRWLTSVANKASKNSGETEPSATAPPVPRAPVESNEERIRKFLEALGQPAGSQPPPRVKSRQMDAERAAREARQRLEQAKRAVEQKKKIFIPAPHIPPLTTVPPPLPVESSAVPQQATTEEGPLRVRSTSAEAPTFEVQDTGVAGSRAAPVPTTPAASINIAALLRSPSGLRNAIILREVFGPPRSLQPLQEFRF